jgi:hypothetical protein
MSGGDRCWYKRGTGEKSTVTGDNIMIIIIIIIIPCYVKAFPQQACQLICPCALMQRSVSLLCFACFVLSYNSYFSCSYFSSGTLMAEMSAGTTDGLLIDCWAVLFSHCISLDTHDVQMTQVLHCLSCGAACLFMTSG